MVIDNTDRLDQLLGSNDAPEQIAQIIIKENIPIDQVLPTVARSISDLTKTNNDPGSIAALAKIAGLLEYFWLNAQTDEKFIPEIRTLLGQICPWLIAQVQELPPAQAAKEMDRFPALIIEKSLTGLSKKLRTALEPVLMMKLANSLASQFSPALSKPKFNPFYRSIEAAPAEPGITEKAAEPTVGTDRKVLEPEMMKAYSTINPAAQIDQVVDSYTKDKSQIDIEIKGRPAVKPEPKEGKPKPLTLSLDFTEGLTGSQDLSKEKPAAPPPGQTKKPSIQTIVDKSPIQPGLKENTPPAIKPEIKKEAGKKEKKEAKQDRADKSFIPPDKKPDYDMSDILKNLKKKHKLDEEKGELA